VEVATGETDEIKFLKSKMRCALSQLEREKQIALKARLKEEEDAEERRIAEQMERDRVAALHVRNPPGPLLRAVVLPPFAHCTA
jgi:hypothetical protein